MHYVNFIFETAKDDGCWRLKVSKFHTHVKFNYKHDTLILRHLFAVRRWKTSNDQLWDRRWNSLSLVQWQVIAALSLVFFVRRGDFLFLLFVLHTALGTEGNICLEICVGFYGMGGVLL